MYNFQNSIALHSLRHNKQEAGEMWGKIYFLFVRYTTKYSKTCLKRTTYIRKPEQTENKFRNGVISHVK